MTASAREKGDEMIERIRAHAVACALLATAVCGTTAAESPPGLGAPHPEVKSAFPHRDHYSPYAGRNFPTQVYWGDTHVHTDNSLDAKGFGPRLDEADAYRFAMGEQVD